MQSFSMARAIASVIDTLKRTGGLQGADIASIADVSPATVSRWLNGKAAPELRTQTILASLRYVVDRLSEFYTPDETRLWLNAPHPMLGGGRAIERIIEGRAEEVLAVIDALDAGAYV
jgi:transcriptional regulator with XRE-family HTH domain